MSLNFDTLFGPYQDRKFTINYDWVDVDSATGYVAYEGFVPADSAGNQYSLEKSSERYNLWGYYTTLNGNNSGTGDETLLDLDFDSGSFKKERVISGRAYIKTKLETTGNANTINKLYFTAKIRKWNATTTTETEIVSVSSAYATATGGAEISRIFCCNVNIPETTIYVGESIRLTMELHLQANNYPMQAYMDFSPQDSTGEARLVFVCPFKIDTGE